MQMFSPRNSGSSHQQRMRLPFLAATFLILGSLVFLALTFVLSGKTPTARAAASWTQIWGDDFNGRAGTGVNTSNWLYDTGTSYPGGAAHWGTGEVETMSSSTSNVYQDGSGHLVIKPIRSSSGAWTSGRIETQRTDFAAPAGGKLAVEASIQQPDISGTAALGYWPAFWMMGAAARPVGATNWPRIGEIDTMEDINGLSSEFATLHCGVDPGGPCNETTGLGSGRHACSGCQIAYHTYRVEVDRSVSPEQIRWYLDGTNFFTVNASQVDATTWANAVDHGFFIILNVAMGGAFPAAFDTSGNNGGPTRSTQSGVPMNVSYVHVFTSSGSTATPTPTATPTSCSSTFTAGVVSSSSTTALPWFRPCDWTAGYVIVHYIVGGNVQQNVYMTYNSSKSRWEYSISGISSGTVLRYSFTYQRNGLQYDTGIYTWTHP